MEFTYKDRTKFTKGLVTGIFISMGIECTTYKAKSAAKNSRVWDWWAIQIKTNVGIWRQKSAESGLSKFA
jgi:hypothetical protein